MHRLVLLLTSCMVLLAGCGAEEPPGRSRSLGAANYDQAFAVAQGVLSRHFEIDSANPETGVIRSRPKAVEAGGERLLGSSPARQVATLKLARGAAHGETLVVARLSIAQQRLGRNITAVAPGPEHEAYSGVPDRTPAHSPGPGGVEKEDDWQTERYVADQEAEILDEIQQAMSGDTSTAPAPATAPTMP